MLTTVYFSLPGELMRNVPGLFLDSALAQIGVLSVDCEGFAEQARLPHASDDPIASLQKFIDLGEQISSRLSEEKERIDELLSEAKALARNNLFVLNCDFDDSSKGEQI